MTAIIGSETIDDALKREFEHTADCQVMRLLRAIQEQLDRLENNLTPETGGVVGYEALHETRPSPEAT